MSQDVREHRPSMAACVARLRCVVCRRGRLAAGWFRLAARCPRCGIDLEREAGTFLGPMYLSFVVTYLAGVSVYVSLALMLGWADLRAVAAAVAAAGVFPLAAWRWLRMAWLALDQSVDPRRPPV